MYEHTKQKAHPPNPLRSQRTVCPACRFVRVLRNLHSQRTRPVRGHRPNNLRTAQRQLCPLHPTNRLKGPNMTYDLKKLTDPAYQSPDTVTLECGHEVPNRPGVLTFNYYDMVWETINRTCERPDISNSEAMPNGLTYWITSVDCSRSCCPDCARHLYDVEIPDL